MIENVTLSKSLQKPNVASSIQVTPIGISISFNSMDEKAYSPILCKFLGRVIFVISVCLNTLSPILITLSGIYIFSNLSFPFHPYYVALIFIFYFLD